MNDNEPCEWGKPAEWSDERISQRIAEDMQLHRSTGEKCLLVEHVGRIVRKVRDDYAALWAETSTALERRTQIRDALQTHIAKRTRTAYRLLACNGELRGRIAELEAENAALRAQLATPHPDKRDALDDAFGRVLGEDEPYA